MERVAATMPVATPPSEQTRHIAETTPDQDPRRAPADEKAEPITTNPT
jgi:hypothetical protein